MLYIVTTTGKCNLKCVYCGGSFSADLVPYSTKYDVDKLASMINVDQDATVVYYGGEPLLNGHFIEELNRRLKVKRIGIQTNGTLVKRFDEEFWKPFDFALLSLDGNEHITDSHRGKGTYRKVIESATYLKSLGKELIARMAITEDSDIHRDVMHLITLPFFDKVHWQLNVVWDRRWNVLKFAVENYLPGMEKLMSYFMERVKKGEIVGIVPILGILSAHYFKKFEYFPCGAGKNAITVNPDGRILACPIGVSEEWNLIGRVGEGFNTLHSPEECKRCSYFGYCGGRCLYSFKERYWGNDGQDEICYITKRTVDIIISRIGELDNLIEEGIIKKDLLYYDPVRDSTEVIP